MKHIVTTTVNGVVREDVVESRTLLVHYLRDTVGLTGTHVGCDTSQCGACTVQVDGQAVKACTMFAAQAEGSDVRTIESLAAGEALDPVQQAFADNHGLQCGYCTPGFIMATRALLERNPDPSDSEIREGLDGNLCRCTGYVNIVKSVRAAAQALAESNGSTT